ncbi:hypothetical protein GIB67_010508, partial [Kingdonia uniflora]
MQHRINPFAGITHLLIFQLLFSCLQVLSRAYIYNPYITTTVTPKSIQHNLYNHLLL